MAKSETDILGAPGVDAETVSRPEGEGEVGKNVEKVDGRGLVTGRAAYTDDIPTERALTGEVVYSPHAHARIASIDTEAALAVDGVKSVLTHENFEAEPFTRQGVPFPQPAPFDERGIDDTVRFVGDVVAAIAADSEEAVEAAVEALDVEYEILDHVLDPAEAMAEGAPTLHDPDGYEHPQVGADPARNIVAEIDSAQGDVDAGFEEADHVVEGEYGTQTVQHAHMEMNTSIAWIDDRDRVVLRTSTQTPHLVRDIIARALDLDRTDIRVVKPRVGGGFGGKQDVVPAQLLAAALALDAGEMVRIETPRDRDLHVSINRHASTSTVRVGVNDDGRITAIHLDMTTNTGAYGNHALTVLSSGGHESLSLYDVDHKRFTGRSVYTNITPAGAMRGYGAPQAVFAVESHLDEVAAEIGIDPLELRRRNLVEEGDKAFDPPFSESERPFTAMGLEECIDRVTDAVGWVDGPDQPDDDRYRRGYGISFMMHKSGVAGDEFAAAEVTLEDDGTATLEVGVGDIGQGAETTMAQIVADVLGIGTGDVHVKADDTDAMPWDNGAYGSSTTYVSGNATEKAAREVAAATCEVATRWLDGDPADLELRDGSVRNTDGDSLPLAEVAERAFAGEDGPKRRLFGYGEHSTDISPHPYGVEVAEVEVDTETGDFELCSFVAAADVGYAIHPENTRGQVIGGAVQGLGQALSEAMEFDDDGVPQVTGLKDYDVPKSTDIPERVECFLVEPYEPTGPFGAKSVGETSIIGAAPAVANAVRDAIGVRVRNLPVTGEKIAAGLPDAE